MKVEDAKDAQHPEALSSLGRGREQYASIQVPAPRLELGAP